MGTTKVCGGTCHNAKRAKCKCWCGGLFHGAAGELARQTFVATFGVKKVPTTERAFLDVIGERDLFTDETAGDLWRKRWDTRGETPKPVAVSPLEDEL